MTKKPLCHLILLIGLLVAGSQPAGAGIVASSAPVTFSHHSGVQTATAPRVNAPHFNNKVWIAESAIFWFGRVTSSENYADLRVGYNDDHLCLRLAAFDRWLWYDSSPSPDDLTAWDAATLYLDLDGNAGDAPDANAYRFVGQLNWWESRDAYQAAYQGDGSGWIATSIPFTTTSGWRGNGLNDGAEDRGWMLSWYIPFDSLGLSGPPAQDTVWGMAVELHDRDDATGTFIGDKTWPETMDPQQPATWGQLGFGLPTYTPPPVVPQGTTTVRQGLDGAEVIDGAVGGGTVCGEGLDFWTEWGETNYAGFTYFNIQNQSDVADWPCFSKYYVTFPLDAIPSGRVIVSATLTLYQFGGSDPSNASRSLIQVMTVAEEWDEATLTWNNAPLAQENVASSWADPILEPVGWDDLPVRTWDVSGAVAYAASAPLRLALYEADYAYNSGKYFVSSDTPDWNAQNRPILTVAWGYAPASVEKTVTLPFGYQNDIITYTLSFLGTGNTLTLTDTLPIGLGEPSILPGSTVTPTYDSGTHHLTWSDAPSSGQQVIISYTAAITTGNREALFNTVELNEQGGGSSNDTATVIANPHLTHLPVILKGQ